MSLQLHDLLAPIETDHFLGEAWEKEPLVIQEANAGRYRGLFSRDDLEAVIAYSRPTFDHGALASVAPRPATYVRGTLGERAVAMSPQQPSIAELRQLYEQGKSLVIMAMQHRWPPVAELCRNLEVAFGCPVHANLYLTPPGSQGFAAHFDTHEVFVLQLEGVKHWRLFAAAQELPLAADSVPLAKRPSTAPREITLGPGDLLYIPRGHVHEASTSDASSLHLTVGVNVYRWSDLLKHGLAHASRQDVSLRRSICGGALAGDKAQLKQQFRSVVERCAALLLTDGLFEQAFDSLADQFLGQLEMLPCGQFRQDAQFGLDTLDLDVAVERNLRAPCRVVEEEQGAAIVFPGNRVAGPHRIGPALRFIAEATRFTARDLPSALTDDGKLVLVRRLVREGLLRIAGCAGRPAKEDFFTGANPSEETYASDAATRQLAEAVGHAGGQGLV